MALRASGHGFRTYIAQFMKGLHYGELDAIKRLGDSIIIEQFGRKDLIHVETADMEDVEMASKALGRAMERMLSGDFQIIILDEVNVAIHFKLLKVEEVMELIRLRPENVELVLTGRYAPSAFVEAADLVTEMRKIEHYYDNGLEARRGIEF